MQATISMVVVAAICLVPLAVLAADLARRARRDGAPERAHGVTVPVAAPVAPAPTGPRPTPRRSRREPTGEPRDGTRCRACGATTSLTLWRVTRDPSRPVRLVCPRCGEAAPPSSAPVSAPAR